MGGGEFLITTKVAPIEAIWESGVAKVAREKKTFCFKSSSEKLPSFKSPISPQSDGAVFM